MPLFNIPMDALAGAVTEQTITVTSAKQTPPPVWTVPNDTGAVAGTAAAARAWGEARMRAIAVRMRDEGYTPTADEITAVNDAFAAARAMDAWVVA